MYCPLTSIYITSTIRIVKKNIMTIYLDNVDLDQDVLGEKHQNCPNLK